MPDQSDWTRVKSEAGHEYSTLVVTEGMQVIDKPAADRYGQPYPPKHNRPLRELRGGGGKSVGDMTVPELLAYANSNGVVLDSDRPKKEEILTAIAEHEGDDPSPDGETTPTPPTAGEDPQDS